MNRSRVFYSLYLSAVILILFSAGSSYFNLTDDCGRIIYLIALWLLILSQLVIKRT